MWGLCLGLQLLVWKTRGFVKLGELWWLFFTFFTFLWNQPADLLMNAGEEFYQCKVLVLPLVVFRLLTFGWCRLSNRKLLFIFFFYLCFFFLFSFTRTWGLVLNMGAVFSFEKSLFFWTGVEGEQGEVSGPEASSWFIQHFFFVISWSVRSTLLIGCFFSSFFSRWFHIFVSTKRSCGFILSRSDCNELD